MSIRTKNSDCFAIFVFASVAANTRTNKKVPDTCKHVSDTILFVLEFLSRYSRLFDDRSNSTRTYCSATFTNFFFYIIDCKPSILVIFLLTIYSILLYYLYYFRKKVSKWYHGRTIRHSFTHFNSESFFSN